MNRASEIGGTPSSYIWYGYICMIGILGGEERKKEEERIFEEIAINFSNVRKICIKFLHLRSSTNLKQYKPKRPTFRHIAVKLSREREKEGILKAAKKWFITFNPLPTPLNVIFWKTAPGHDPGRMWGNNHLQASTMPAYWWSQRWKMKSFQVLPPLFRVSHLGSHLGPLHPLSEDWEGTEGSLQTVLGEPVKVTSLEIWCDNDCLPSEGCRTCPVGKQLSSK